MHIISKKKLREFWEVHADAQGPLMNWYKVVRKARWQKFADVRSPFPSADLVGKCTIFNIGGNKYRLIVIITRNWRKVLIRFVLTHEKYDKGQWTKDCGC